MSHRIYMSLGVIMLLAGCAQQNSPSPMPIGPNTLNVADAAIAGGDPSMALSVTQAVLNTDPNNVDALVHEGDAYYALQRCPAAEAAYQRALQSDPKSTAAETGLARCLLKTDPAAAEAALLLAIQDDPGNAAAYNDLGIARDLQGNFAGAVDPYQKALIADPSLTAAEVNLGLSLALSGNGPAALQYLGPLATSQQATPKIREDYAAALVASGRTSEARQILAIDLTTDQVNSAMDGFNAVIAGAQTPLADQSAPPAAPTTTIVPTTGVSATPLTPQAVAAPPAPVTPASRPAPLYTPDNSTAAYTGPSPIPNAISSSTGGPVPATAAPDEAAPKIATASAQPAPAPVAAALPAAASAPLSSDGSYKVQLASLGSEADAQREWSKISGAMPALFGDKQPDIENAVVNGKTYYRLRTGSFGSKQDAAKFCGEVSASGSTCTLANF